MLYRVRIVLLEMLSFVIVLFFLSEFDINFVFLDFRLFFVKFCEEYIIMLLIIDYCILENVSF